ncbi:MAG TPA: hypothetical protein VL422_02365, partial [Miltoncostaea sp.]|nr:hypothetical protein [Miltoncostaea sp.]
TGAIGTVRTMARVAVTTVDDGAHARTTKARKVKIAFDRKVLYEIDGGDREKVRSLKIKVVPGGLTVCVPYAALPEPSARQVHRVEA